MIGALTAAADFGKMHKRSTALIPFLIRKLEREHWGSRKAFEILARMGAPIWEPLIAILQDTEADPDLKAHALGLLCKTRADAASFSAFNSEIISGSSSRILLEAAMNARFDAVDHRLEALEQRVSRLEDILFKPALPR